MWIFFAMVSGPNETVKAHIITEQGLGVQKVKMPFLGKNCGG